MSEKLKPCPFCGGEDIRITAHPHAGVLYHAGETVYSMCCYECGATFPNRYKRELLVEAWNRRHQEQDQTSSEFERLLAK